MIFLIFPLLEKLCPGTVGQLCIALLCILVNKFFELPSILGIATVPAYLPYFITGHCLARCDLKAVAENVQKNKAQCILVWVAPVAIYCALDAVELVWGYELDLLGRYVRAMAVISVLACLAFIFNAVFRQNRIWSKLHDLLVDCSRYSLQVYVFNGYLMTLLRIVICRLLHITAPLVIVLGIWLGDLFITLVLCKYVCRKIPIIGTLCGIV